MQPSRALVLAVLLLSTGAAPAAAAELPSSGTLDLEGATAKQASAITAKEGGFTGRSVAALGDFNGDGKGDLAVGESQGDGAGRKDSGVVHVVLEPGRKGALETAAAVRISGAGADDRAGFDVAPAGDVDGDGLADLLIGAPVAGDREEEGAQFDGVAYLVLGRRGAAEIDLAAPQFGGMRITAPGERSYLGHAVASMPDVTGDGRRELLIGAPKRDSAGRRDAGAVHVVSARTSGDVDLTQPQAADAGFRVEGPPGSAAGGALAGYAVDAIDDLDGDKLSDVVVGVPRAASGPANTTANGAAFVVFSRGGGVVDLDRIGNRGYAVRGRTSAKGEERDGPGDWFGGAVAGLGDLTGDGRPDLAIGAHLADGPDRPRGGQARIVPGGASAPDAAAGFSVVGVGAGDATGMAVSPAGDFNADGLADVVIGAPLSDPLTRTDAGAAYVVFGARDDDAADLDLAEFGTRALRIAGATPGGTAGFSLAAAGDVDGDGGPDLALGAPSYKVADAFRPSVPGPGGLAIAFGAAGAKDIPGGEIKEDPGYQEAIAAGCRPRTNVQAVIEDNAYTEEEADPERIRLTGFQEYVTRPRNFGTVLGVTGFGGDGENTSEVVLEPTPLGADEDGKLRRLLKAEIDGEDEFPGYETMFRTLATDNPAADARIMIVDGVLFREVRELEGLVDGAAPTYIVAIGEPEGRTRRDIRQMKLVAKATKARYYETRGPAELQRALEAIESRLRCDVEEDRFQEELQAGEDEEEVADVEVDEDAYSADVSLTWPDGTDSFEFEDVDILDEDGDLVESLDDEELEDALDEEPYEDEDEDEQAEDAQAGGNDRTTSVTAAARGRRFRSLHVTGLRPGGRLRVAIRAGRDTRGRVVTRVTQSRRRG